MSQNSPGKLASYKMKCVKVPLSNAEFGKPTLTAVPVKNAWGSVGDIGEKCVKRQFEGQER